MRQTVYPMSNHSSFFAYTAAYDGKINRRPQTAITKKRPAAGRGLCKKAYRKEIPLLSCLSFGEKQKIRSDKPSFGARRTHPQPERRGAAAAVCRKYRRR